MCSVIAVSFLFSGLSVSTKIRSKRDMRAGGRSIWSAMGVSSSNLPYLGFAAASIEHLHCSVAVIPALATETSGTPWPRAARTCPDPSSCPARRCRPDPCPPGPVPRPPGSISRPRSRPSPPRRSVPPPTRTSRRRISLWAPACSCTSGAATSRLRGLPSCISPLITVPSSISLWQPPNSCRAMAFFTESSP